MFQRRPKCWGAQLGSSAVRRRSGPGKPCFCAQTSSAARKRHGVWRISARHRGRRAKVPRTRLGRMPQRALRFARRFVVCGTGACRDEHLDCDTASRARRMSDRRRSVAAAPLRHALYKSNQVFSVHERATLIMRSTGQIFEQNSARRDTMGNREALRGQRVGQMTNWQSCTMGFTPSDRMTFASTSGSNDCGCTLGRYA
jgi:hypothetical protein